MTLAFDDDDRQTVLEVFQAPCFHDAPHLLQELALPFAGEPMAGRRRLVAANTRLLMLVFLCAIARDLRSIEIAPQREMLEISGEGPEGHQTLFHPPRHTGEYLAFCVRVLANLPDEPGTIQRGRFTAVVQDKQCAVSVLFCQGMFGEHVTMEITTTPVEA